MTAKTENWTLGTWTRASGETTDVVKAKELQDGTILVTHSWTVEEMPAGHRETIKTTDQWQRQYDYLRDNGFARARQPERKTS
jgi:hypothetical protein